MKRTSSDITKSILSEGEILATAKTSGIITMVVVRAFGQTYRIDNPYSKKPIITQLEN